MISTAIALAGLSIGALAPHDTDQHHEPLRPNHTGMQIISDSQIIVDGHEFESWEAVADSGYFDQPGTRCGCADHLIDPAAAPQALGSGADCSLSFTNPAAEYDPQTETYRIPVVVHVIQRTNGTGFISQSRVESQIEILNEDLNAIAGTNGAGGNFAGIEFYLATEDPSGNPTNGITYSTNNTWFNDGGAYYNALAWDTDEYLNIYTNSASGALGYVPFLPQQGGVGSDSDRVVVLYSTFGRNAPFSPFNLGRTGTHEVGHYLGLLHTFGSCSNSNSSGDLISDTNAHFNPTFGCPGSDFECGGNAPIDNYMNYSDDRCMGQFTPVQNRRMRCTLLNYRPDLFSVAGDGGPCSPIDFAEPFGEISFPDVADFLAFFSAQDDEADLTGDGVVNFIDVSAFVTLFAAGCP